MYKWVGKLAKTRWYKAHRTKSQTPAVYKTTVAPAAMRSCIPNASSCFFGWWNKTSLSLSLLWNKDNSEVPYCCCFRLCFVKEESDGTTKDRVLVGGGNEKACTAKRDVVLIKMIVMSQILVAPRETTNGALWDKDKKAFLIIMSWNLASSSRRRSNCNNRSSRKKNRSTSDTSSSLSLLLTLFFVFFMRWWGG